MINEYFVEKLRTRLVGTGLHVATYGTNSWSSPCPPTILISLRYEHVPICIEWFGLTDKYSLLYTQTISVFRRQSVLNYECRSDGVVRNIYDKLEYIVDNTKMLLDPIEEIKLMKTTLKNRALLKLTQELGRELTALIEEDLRRVGNE